MLTGKLPRLFLVAPVLAMLAVGCRAQTDNAPNDLPTEMDTQEGTGSRTDDATTARAAESDPTEVADADETVPADEAEAPAAPAKPAEEETPATPAPAVDKIVATVDGKVLKNEKLLVIAESDVQGTKGTNLYINLSGTGLTASTRFAIRVTKAVKGCAAQQQYIQYQPSDGTFDTYFTASDATCPLTVTQIPGATEKRVKLSFTGTMKTQGATIKTRTIKLEVDVAVPPAK